MGCEAPGELIVNFASKSQLSKPVYVNQHNTCTDHIGYRFQCTWYAADRVEQLTGVDLETYASAWGNGGEWWQTAKRFGFPVYGAQEALNKRGTLAGYVISFEKAKAGYGTHVAVVESYDPASKTAWVSEMWGSENNGTVHIVKYTMAELFHSDMHYIDFSSIGLGETMTDDEVKKIYAAHKAEKVYNTIDDVPDFAKETVRKLIEKGLLVGEGENKLNLTYDLCRILVINNRAGLYD